MPSDALRRAGSTGEKAGGKGRCLESFPARNGSRHCPHRLKQLNVDESLFMVGGRERVGAGALSPFVMWGVVCSGAKVIRVREREEKEPKQLRDVNNA